MDTPLSSISGSGLLAEFRKFEVWLKARPISGKDPNVSRCDAFGNEIWYADYGDRSSRFGWEIDHVVPVSLGGSDDLSNLRPLHHRANATLGGILGALLR